MVAVMEPMSDNKPIRLNKFLSQCGIASRRGADALIESGKVRVNGNPAQPGQKIMMDLDRVTVEGKPVHPRQEQVTLILHKPVRVVTTLHDPQQRTTVLDLLPAYLRQVRPVPVGRLDFFSEGLLLMTTDGELCNRLTHPRHHLAKHYDVTIRGAVSEAALQTMRQGMRLSEGEMLAPVGVKAKPLPHGDTRLELRLSQGVNRQIRRMCRDLDLTLLRLRRVAQGPIHLGSLDVGKWRELSSQELAKLRAAVAL